MNNNNNNNSNKQQQQQQQQQQTTTTTTTTKNKKNPKKTLPCSFVPSANFVVNSLYPFENCISIPKIDSENIPKDPDAPFTHRFFHPSGKSLDSFFTFSFAIEHRRQSSRDGSAQNDSIAVMSSHIERAQLLIHQSRYELAAKELQRALAAVQADVAVEVGVGDVLA